MDLMRLYEWTDIKTTLLFCCLFLLLRDYIINKAMKNFPPGPWSLPIIGHLYHIDHKTFHLQLAKVDPMTLTYLDYLYFVSSARVQEEIDRVVGGSRQPSLSDKDNMLYTNAVIHEIQRIGNIDPLNLPRATVEDTQKGTYSIPKGTAVIGSLTSVLFDESEWETPHSFNPGHFLDAEGKFRKRDAFLPFSLGKRVCLGEQLARMELFLFFSSLLQRFTFSSPAGVEPSMDYRLGTTRCPQPYKLCAVPSC